MNILAVPQVPVLNTLPEEDIQRYAPAASMWNTTSVKGAAQFWTPKFQEQLKFSKG